MRRLIAYKEIVTEGFTERNYGQLSIVHDYYLPVTGLEVILSFTYNYSNYAVITYRVGFDVIDAAALASLSVDQSTVVIPVAGFFFEMDDFRSYANIGEMIAIATSSQLVTNEIDGDEWSSVIRADYYSSANQFTSIVHSMVSATASNYQLQEPNPIYSKDQSFDLDIDKDTSLGVTYNSFDFKEPSLIGINHSNTFTLPRTSTNDRLSGFFGESDEIYETWYVDYFLGNEQIIKGGKLSVLSVSKDRLNVGVTTKNSIIDRLKQIRWNDFQREYFEWLEDNSTTFFGTYTLLLNNITVATTHTYLPAIYGDLFDITNPNTGDITIAAKGVSEGQLCTYVRSIFEFVQFKYNLNFFAGTFNVFNYINPFIQNRYLTIKKTGTNYRIAFTRGKFDSSIQQYNSDKVNKTLYDFIHSFIVYTNCIVDIIDENNIALQQMDKLDIANPLDFSGKIVNNIEFYPLIDSIGQTNSIDFADYSELLQKGSLRKDIICNNRSAEGAVNYLTIPTFIPPAFLDRSRLILALYEKKTFEEFTFLTDNGATLTYNVKNIVSDFVTDSSNRTLKIGTLLPIGYTLISQIIDKPRMFRINKWITIADLAVMDNFKRYWIEELRGTFMLSKIKGFNPEASQQATEMEFIQINGFRPIELDQ